MSDTHDAPAAVGGPRLFLDAALAAGAEISLSREASNYLFAVMRLGEGAACGVASAARHADRADRQASQRR